jgi:hypothetical protein
MSTPKYVERAVNRIAKLLSSDPQYTEGRRNTSRRMRRILDHPEYGRKFAQLPVKDQKRILSRVHRPFTVSPAKKQKLIFSDIDDTLKRKKHRLAQYKESRKLGIRGGTGTPAERAQRYAQLGSDTRSDAWPGDESTEFWAQYKREMGYAV